MRVHACLAVCPGAVALIIRYNYHCNLSVIMRPPRPVERETTCGDNFCGVVVRRTEEPAGGSPSLPLSHSAAAAAAPEVRYLRQTNHGTTGGRGRTDADGDARSPIWLLLLRLLTPIIRPRPQHNAPGTAFDQVCDRIVH